jgi:uncharacterized OB-fold protein
MKNSHQNIKVNQILHQAKYTWKNDMRTYDNYNLSWGKGRECEICNKFYSPKQTNCPHCGYKNDEYKKSKFGTTIKKDATKY